MNYETTVECIGDGYLDKPFRERMIGLHKESI